MAAGITDHVWTMEELLSYRVPPDFRDQLDQQAIDRQFAAMAGDAPYQELNMELLQEFAGNDSQASTARDESP